MAKKALIIVTKGEIGGAQIFALNLAKTIIHRGFEATVGFGDGDYLPKELSKAGLPYIRFNWLKRTKSPFSNLMFIFELRKFVKNENFNVVHFNSSNTLFGAVGLIGLPIKKIFTFHGLSLLDENYRALGIMKWFYLLLFRLLLRFIDTNVFVSKANYDRAINIGAVKNGEIIYNGVDIDEKAFLNRLEARHYLENVTGISLADGIVLGSVGRLAYPKNYEFLIDVFPEIKNIFHNIKLLIIGEGPLRQKYSEMISAGGLEKSIFLAGEVGEAYKYLRAFDVFLQPSEFEGMSFTIIEALYAEVPIIAARVGGTSEILKNSAGLLYAVNDKNEFLSAITKLLSDSKMMDSVRVQARIQKDLFTLQEMGNSYAQIYG